MLAPLTGDVKTFGESQQKAYEIVVEETNAEGKVIIETVTADEKNDATEGVNAANKLINQDGVNAIVGPLTSKVAIAVSEVAQANKVLMITGTGTAPEVTVDGGQRKDYVFRACFIDPFQGTMMAKFARQTLGAEKAAVVYDLSNDYSKGLAEYFKAAFEEHGGQVVAYESYGKDDVDFSGILTKVAAAQPEVLYIPDYYNKVNLIAAQTRDRGIQATLLGGDGWDSAELDTTVTEGGYFTNHYSPDDQRPEVQEWVSKYKAKYGQVPDALATLAYDATRLLVQATIDAGTNDPTAIRDAMAQIKDFPGVTGSLSFDENGNPIKSAVVLKIENGAQKYVETVNPE